MLGFFFDPLYLLLISPFALLALWAQARVKGTYAKYRDVPLRSGMSGAEVASRILRAGGIEDVSIAGTPGMLSDHYDPTRRVVVLSEDILHGRSVAAAAVAAHEVGHALQHAQGYKAMQARAALVPVVQFGSSLAIPMIVIGALLANQTLALIGVILFSFAVLFHLVTLPVEFDASRRAIQILERSGIAVGEEMHGVRKMLYAAGFTYIAATLVAVAQLLYFLLRTGLLGGGSRDEA
jgi:Zn-dependent membrane protease YugP